MPTSNPLPPKENALFKRILVRVLFHNESRVKMLGHLTLVKVFDVVV